MRQSWLAMILALVFLGVAEGMPPAPAPRPQPATPTTYQVDGIALGMSRADVLRLKGQPLPGRGRRLAYTGTRLELDAFNRVDFVDGRVLSRDGRVALVVGADPGDASAVLGRDCQYRQLGPIRYEVRYPAMGVTIEVAGPMTVSAPGRIQSIRLHL